MTSEIEKKYLFPAGILVFLASVLLYFVFLEWDIKIDFVLTALVVLAIFLKLEEIVLLSILGIWVFNFKPALSLEMIWFLVLPVLTFGLNKFLPGKNWFSALVSVFISFIIFYASINFSLLFGSLVVSLGIMLPTLAFGVLVFMVFEFIFNSNEV